MGSCCGKGSKGGTQKKEDAYKVEDEENDKKVNNNETKAADSDHQQKELGANPPPEDKKNSVKSEKKEEQPQQQEKKEENKKNEDNSNSNNKEIQEKKIIQNFSVPEMYKSQDITIEAKWGYLQSECIFEYLATCFKQNQKDFKALFQNIEKILKAMGIEKNEDKVILSRRIKTQLDGFIVGYDNSRCSDVRELYTKFIPDFDKWLPIIYLDSDNQFFQSYGQLMELSFGLYYYINNLVTVQKNEITKKEGYFSLQAVEHYTYLSEQINTVKKSVLKDFPFLENYKVNHQQAKIKATVMLNELYTSVQRQFRKNLTPQQLSEEYLLAMYENVLDMMEEIVPQDDYEHQGIKAHNYAYQVKLIGVTKR